MPPVPRSPPHPIGRRARFGYICSHGDLPRLYQNTAGTDTPPHEHTAVEEVCYCLSGELTCEVEGEPSAVLRPGQKMRFAAGRDHRLSNPGQSPCQFLLIHGVGRFDFVPSR